jgi:hypothetical protein
MSGQSSMFKASARRGSAIEGAQQQASEARQQAGEAAEEAQNKAEEAQKEAEELKQGYGY